MEIAFEKYCSDIDRWEKIYDSNRAMAHDCIEELVKLVEELAEHPERKSSLVEHAHDYLKCFAPFE